MQKPALSRTQLLALKKTPQRKPSPNHLSVENPAVDDYSMEALGRRLRIARIRRNLAIWEIALVTGFNRNTISALEHGHEGTSMAVLWAVLTFFKQQEIMASIADPDKDDYGKCLEEWMRSGRSKPIVKPYTRSSRPLLDW